MGPVIIITIPMAGTVYLKCSCGKSNPIYDEIEPNKEYTCIFCGALFKAPSMEDESVTSKKPRGKKAPITKRKAPINRNQNKPLL